MRLLVATPLTLESPELFDDCIEGEPVYWNTVCTHPKPIVSLDGISLGCECEWGFSGVLSGTDTDAAIVVDEPRMTGALYLRIIEGAMARDLDDVRFARETAFTLMVHAKRLGTGAVVVRRRGELHRRRPYASLTYFLEALERKTASSGTR